MTRLIIPRGFVPPGEEPMALKFVCPPRFEGGPLDPVPPNRLIRRNLDEMIDLPLPPEVAARTRAGKDAITLWVIEDPDLPDPFNRTFPSPPVRLVVGEVLHAFVGFKFNDHTIHWHGIEPTPMNDGVGHTSFEGTAHFVYQMQPQHPGTFFYHCHKNTVLHFEMGLYGAYIVDPLQPDPNSPLQPPFATGGPGLAFAVARGFPGFNPATFTVPYDVEAFWAVDEFDSTWHELNHDAFMQKCDANDPMNPKTFTQDGFLNDFRPDVFLITGVVSVPTTPPGVFPEQGAPITDPRVAITAHTDQTVLIRLLNSGYTVQEYVLGVDALCTSTDGRGFGTSSNPHSQPFVIPKNTPFRLTTARRLELLVRTPSAPAVIPFQATYIDWIKGKRYHTARTQITVVP